MVAVKSLISAAVETKDVLAELAKGVDDAGLSPDLVCVFYDANHDDRLIFQFLQDRFPEAQILGGTSCGGAMSETGLGGSDSVGLLMIEDPDGDYGVASVTFDDDPAMCAERALNLALENAGCPGELPELIWIYQAPGQEEKVIAGLRRVVGDRCPIIGGSAADNAVAGQWRQIGPDGPISNGLAIGVLFSSGGIGFAFQGGYEPSGPSGIVTKVGYGTDGNSGVVTQARGRQIVSIDGEPAAEVYNRWLDGALSEKLRVGGSILTDTTMHPLGIDAGKIEDVTCYLVVHPDQISTEGTLSTFAEIEVGTRLYSMRGDKNRLVDRAGKVAAAAAAGIPGGIANLAGGLVVYCAGCKLAIDDQMDRVSKAIATSFDGMPFVGCFTFGEQGLVLDRNAHGNLMISAIAFGK